MDAAFGANNANKIAMTVFMNSCYTSSVGSASGTNKNT